MRRCYMCNKRLWDDERVWVVPEEKVRGAPYSVKLECHGCKIKRVVKQIKEVSNWKDLMLGEIHQIVFKTKLASDEGLQTFGVLIEALRKITPKEL